MRMCTSGQRGRRADPSGYQNREVLGDRINLPAGIESGLVPMESSHKTND
jgi:hypothetical protein